MKQIKEILEQLKLDKQVIQIFEQKIDVAELNSSYSPADYWYPHPPCFIPVFIGYGVQYKGVIKHWFCKRKEVFAQYLVESQYLLEIGRNSKQIFIQIIYELIELEGDLSDEILQIGEKLDLNENELNRILDFLFKNGGALIPPFGELDNFGMNIPLTYVPNLSDYNGDFPSSEKLLVKDNLENACGFEIADRASLQDNGTVPIWLISDADDKKEMFNEFYSQGKLKEAWLTLNSPGWEFEDVAKYLKQIADSANDNLFYKIAENWIAGWKASDFTDKGLGY